MLYNQICMWFPGCNFSWSGPCEWKTGHSCSPHPHLFLWWDKDRTTAIDALIQKGRNGRNIASLSVAILESGGKNVARFLYFWWVLASRTCCFRGGERALIHHLPKPLAPPSLFHFLPWSLLKRKHALWAVSHPFSYPQVTAHFE